MPIFELNASASSILCVVNMTADFLRCYEIRATIVHMNLLASGSIPAEGSSNRIIGGLPRIAIATDSFLLFPPLKVPAGFFL